MDIQEEVKAEESKANENSVSDLTVTDEQSDSTKGGAAIGLIVGGAGGAGSLAVQGSKELK